MKEEKKPFSDSINLITGLLASLDFISFVMCNLRTESSNTWKEMALVQRVALQSRRLKSTAWQKDISAAFFLFFLFFFLPDEIWSLTHFANLHIHLHCRWAPLLAEILTAQCDSKGINITFSQLSQRDGSWRKQPWKSSRLRSKAGVWLINEATML